MEAIKVRMQTTLPPYANNLREGWSKIVQNEGYAGLYKGLYPLWARQIPYTMVKFATFESAVSQIYKTLGRPKESYSSLAQTGVSFAGGYIAGIGCAVVVGDEAVGGRAGCEVFASGLRASGGQGQ